MTTDERAHELAQTVCTPSEQEALGLEAAGLSERNIALALDISRRTVRDRLWNARRKIDIALRNDTLDELTRLSQEAERRVPLT